MPVACKPLILPGFSKTYHDTRQKRGCSKTLIFSKNAKILAQKSYGELRYWQFSITFYEQVFEKVVWLQPHFTFETDWK